MMPYCHHLTVGDKTSAVYIPLMVPPLEIGSENTNRSLFYISPSTPSPITGLPVLEELGLITEGDTALLTVQVSETVRRLTQDDYEASMGKGKVINFLHSGLTKEESLSVQQSIDITSFRYRALQEKGLKP